MIYIYPDNLKSAPMLFLWRLKDLVVIGTGALISVFALSQTGMTLPIVITVAYSFLAIRVEDISILDFLKYAVNYFIIEQQEYRWKLTEKGGFD